MSKEIIKFMVVTEYIIKIGVLIGVGVGIGYWVFK